MQENLSLAMKQTIRRWDREQKKYYFVEADMTDYKGTILEIGQKVLYAKATKSAPAQLEEAEICNLGDGFVTLLTKRSHWKWNPETKSGHYELEDSKVRLVSNRGNYQDDPEAKFMQLAVMSQE